MRADRLVETLLLLQARGRMTAGELAEELEVSVRTVMRDLEALGSAGVPLYAERGPGGGFELWEGFTTQLTSVTADEARVAGLIGLGPAVADLGLDPAISRLLLKVLQALPDDLHALAELGQNEVRLDLPPDGDAERLRFLFTAIRRRRQVRATRGGSPVLLHPYGLLRRPAGWHVVGGTPSDVEVVPVDALSEYETTGRRFDRPDDFDLASFSLR